MQIWKMLSNITVEKCYAGFLICNGQLIQDEFSAGSTAKLLVGVVVRTARAETQLIVSAEGTRCNKTDSMAQMSNTYLENPLIRIYKD